MRTIPLLPLVAALGLAATAPGQVGSPLPKVALEGFSGTDAQSLEDFQGRLLLVEYFAYW